MLFYCFFLDLFLLFERLSCCCFSFALNCASYIAAVCHVLIFVNESKAEYIQVEYPSAIPLLEYSCLCIHKPVLIHGNGLSSTSSIGRTPRIPSSNNKVKRVIFRELIEVNRVHIFIYLIGNVAFLPTFSNLLKIKVNNNVGDVLGYTVSLQLS
jgi:hypothetical protein